MKDRFHRELESILENNTSGSTELLSALNELFLKHADNIKQIEHALPRISRKFESFALFRNYLKKLGKTIRDKPDYLNSFLTGTHNSYTSLYQSIFENAKPFLKNYHIVITISNSKTLLEVFRIWNQYAKFKVIIAESRPMEEGKILADHLVNSGIKTELITDAMVSQYVPKADSVIIGADMILSNGNVINKSGSNVLAVLASYYSKPFLVLSSKDKITRRFKFRPANSPSSEIWEYQHDFLRITNRYFEEIDKKLITKIITD